MMLGKKETVRFQSSNEENTKTCGQYIRGTADQDELKEIKFRLFGHVDDDHVVARQKRIKEN